ncbi:MAG: hypothetical protein A2913_00795 [Parcubacteria group bacterium RIFCSPLOWO2_01_FULL_40_65]|nr:MAG: hypothetical protein A2734_02515 [Parcubacteria group bacterium RIFCSPHIGHO2_01_FULL_40_30]OHB19420.1 MAG: hypothetical protein A3D40_00635 [Parcubacteria group bacterium RIFCSPHIGHO2_02_FULL_40_12]OHB21118.1 MAG: hypothetical protein A2913_00795 [Parcubacteria group bacterium RIFCSPLOWO2_01_FULL_40_65]OHB23448.1 MAG: hypothetical protein A3I22_01450 [Parcubacteria group bacterium RIFCSPLOWO2_02_FULL_40_12]OHB23913.1 MAG: hypothetical protein A3F96_01665 [Parcubacteria group bacterium R
MKRVLLIVILVILFGRGEAFAQWGFGGFGGFSPFGGNEAARVVAGNQAMIWSLAGQWQPYIYPNQQVMCRPMSVGHRFADIGLGALAVGGSTAIWTRNAGAVVGGAAAGAGGVGLYSQHERECQLISSPAVQPAAVIYQAVPVERPQSPATDQPVAEPAEVTVAKSMPRLAGVRFKVINETNSIIVVEVDGKRAVLAQRAQAQVNRPDPRVLLIQPDGKGSFDEFEIDLRGTEDSILPGWRIPASVKLKGP